MGKPLVTVVIPAHNGGPVEVIVVCNRCTDRTAEIAEGLGARVLFNEDRCIAKVRNAGIFAAKGSIVMTIDCDNRMTSGTVKEAVYLLGTGKYIGGGAPMRFERYSLPLYLNDLICRIGFGITGLYCGIFWAEKKTFTETGGFVEKKAMEDAATAKRLKAYGKLRGKKFTTLRRNMLINSTRKYDDLGDMLYFKLIFTNLRTFARAALDDRKDLDKLLDRLFYDYNK